MIGVREYSGLNDMMLNDDHGHLVIEYNPRYFEEPDEYRPSRWYGKENEAEAVTAFSIGACRGLNVLPFPLHPDATF